ncbi:MAG: type II secretion system F family protein [Planctomycetes bacterium]|nr:type II secretion system F family protein [Planctomycetota bacterium]MCB9909413.1 type II secretion system F family protein [Planctomycetota bacterium]
MAKRIQRTQKQAPDRSGGGESAETKARGGRRGKRVPRAVVSDFTVQLATLTEAGIPVVRALTILEGQTKPGVFKSLLAELTDDVSGGMTLSESMAKHPRAFDSLYTNMVKAGEAGGVLDRILTRVAMFREKAEQVRAKVSGAMVYPTLLTVVAIGVVAAVIIFVIPKFEAVFRSFNVGLPRTTQILLDISNFAVTYWYLVILLPFLLFLLHVVLMGRSTGYRYRIHALLLKLPILGGLIRDNLTGAFARTFGTLVQAGVPHLDSLGIVRDTATNAVMVEAVGEIRRTVREGEGIARPMGESGLFDDVVVNMVDVGEETGELDNMLLKVAETYERRFDRRTDAMLSLLEPMLVIFMAFVVGFIVVALFLPLIGIMNSIQGAG